MIVKRIFFSVVAVIALTITIGFLADSCSTASNPERNYAIAIAKQELAKRGGGKRTRLTGAKLIDGHWHVRFERFPPVPGGHATVIISVEAKVVAYSAGR
jgi:hypothetical protein